MQRSTRYFCMHIIVWPIHLVNRIDAPSIRYIFATSHSRWLDPERQLLPTLCSMTQGRSLKKNNFLLYGQLSEGCAPVSGESYPKDPGESWGIWPAVAAATIGMHVDRFVGPTGWSSHGSSSLRWLWPVWPPTRRLRMVAVGYLISSCGVASNGIEHQQLPICWPSQTSSQFGVLHTTSGMGRLLGCAGTYWFHQRTPGGRGLMSEQVENL